MPTLVGRSYPIGAAIEPGGVNFWFLTAHDGFTLKDRVSYNEANGEDNRDGSNDNYFSWNCGAEGRPWY